MNLWTGVFEVSGEIISDQTLESLVGSNSPHWLFDIELLGTQLSWFLSGYLLLSVLIAIWLYTLIWVAKDASARSHSLWFQILSLLLVTLLTPLVGFPLYLLIRPLTYKHDNNGWRTVLLLQSIRCYNCNKYNHRSSLFCMHCGESLTVRCKNCGSDYGRDCEYCTQCGAPNID
jgi:hypothetical protein